MICADSDLEFMDDSFDWLEISVSIKAQVNLRSSEKAKKKPKQLIVFINEQSRAVKQENRHIEK